MDSCVVLAWICEYGDGLYRWTPVSLHGFAVVVLLHGLAVSNTFWDLGMVSHLVNIGC